MRIDSKMDLPGEYCVSNHAQLLMTLCLVRRHVELGRAVRFSLDDGVLEKYFALRKRGVGKRRSQCNLLERRFRPVRPVSDLSEMPPNRDLDSPA
jgi:hypothetical protein